MTLTPDHNTQGAEPAAGASPRALLGWGGLALIVLSRIVLQLQLLGSGFRALTADEFARMTLAQRWALTPQAIWNGVWLPFHQYLFGSLLRLRWDMIDTPRYVTMLFGSLSIIVIYALTLRLSRSIGAALLSAMLLAANPAHTWLSAMPLTETPYIFFVLLGLLGAVLYVQERRQRYLYLAALAFLGAQGFRFESWATSGIFAALIWFDALRREPKAALRLIPPTGLVLAFPAAWMLSSYRAYGHPLASLKMTTGYNALWYGSDRDFSRHLRILHELDPLLLPALAAGALALALWRTRRADYLWLLAMIAIPTAVFVVFQGGQPQPRANFIRYLWSLCLPAYALIGLLADRIARRWVGRRLGVAMICLLGLVAIINMQTSRRYLNDTAAYGLPVGEKAAAIHRGPGAPSILVERVYWEFLAANVNANGLPSLLYDRPVNWATRTSTSVLAGGHSADQLRSCLAQHEVGAVFASTPEIIASVEQTLGLTAQERINHYRLYLITPAQRAEWRLLPPCRFSFYPAI